MEKREKTENEIKKDFLNSYKVEKRAVKRLEEQLEELRHNRMSPSCMIGDGMPHGNEISDLSDYAVMVDELDREIKACRYKRIRAYQEVRTAIECMEDEREKDLLTYRYIKGYGWERIAVEMKYTWQHLHKIHSVALKNFKVAIECEGKSVI